MGLLKAGAGALGGVLADSWRDYFYCESMPMDVLMTKGMKRTSDKGRSSNTKGESNIISNGSIIAVNEGQCMLIVEQGAIVDVCAEAGEFVYDTSTEPSVFYGDLGEGIAASFSRMGERFGFGGDAGKDQRVYFVNTKEIMGNKYGTQSPIPFRVVDTNIGLDLDTAVRMNGEYSYHIIDPLKFYKEVCANVEGSFTRDKIDSQMKSELLTAMQPALAKISAMGIRYSAVPAHTAELADALNDEMSEDWRDLRGLEIKSFGVNAITISPEDEDRIKQLQTAATMRDPNMAAANIAAAQAEAMRTAAANEGGATNAFLGMGMANMAGGMSAGNLFAQGGGQQVPQSNYPTAQGGGFGGQPQPVQAQGGAAAGWTCSCGAVSEGAFCPNCGSPKPAPAAQGAWTCECGAQSTGKFCPNCGKPVPAGPWTCECGAQNEGKFCPNCGSPRP